MWSLLVFQICGAAAVSADPRVIYGTAWKQNQTTELVRLALRQGFRAFDTAAMPQHYDEPQVGDALKEAMDPSREGSLKRDELWIQTKFTPSEQTTSVAAAVRASFTSSLSNLGVSYLDSFLLHAPFQDRADTLTAWREMEQIHREGLSKKIGVSNFDAEQLYWLLDKGNVAPSVVQNRCLAKQNWDEEVRLLCDLHGIRYQGFWLLTGNRQILNHEVTQNVARYFAKTPQQVLFRYAIQALNISALSGTRNPEHMSQDLEVETDHMELTADAVQAMAGIVAPYDLNDHVHVEFHNALGTQVELFWMSESGEAVPNGRLEPDGTLLVDTRHSHQFVAKTADGATVWAFISDRSHGERQLATINTAVNVEFINVGLNSWSLFWRHPDGKEETFMAVLHTREAVERGTHVGHVFVARRESGEAIHEWTMEPSATRSILQFGDRSDEL